LPDDQQPEHRGHEQEHRQQPHAGSDNFPAHERPNDLPGDPEFLQQHAQRDERERAEPLNGEQKKKQPSPEVI
jgi:hypothetical protein